MTQSLAPGLYIVATPIGNLGDITRRAVETLGAADLVACEDTRVTGKLLNLLGLKRPLLRHDDHADDEARTRLIERMRSEAVALVTDAGTPLVSDPGYRLVRDARTAGIVVTALPGPCAAIAALAVAGQPTDRFLFAGFLPAKAKARDDALAELAGMRATLVFYETGPRLAASLAAMAEGLGEREASVARELTKLHEECITGPLADLAARYAGQEPKGEIVIVVAPPAPPPPDEDAALRLLDEALSRLPAGQAATEVARATGADRKRLYARALERKTRG